MESRQKQTHEQILPYIQDNPTAIPYWHRREVAVHPAAPFGVPIHI
jgi:hypothetical protein